MNEKLSNYTGREQTYIKHQFLTKYLQRAAYIILQRHSRTFNFVDAFAGPWQVGDSQNYSDASFDQALRTLDEVRTDLVNRGLTGLRVRFCFCEKRPKASEQLRHYAQKKSNFDIHVFSGSFEDNLDAISKVITGGFTFTFIDPTGWNIRSKKIFRFLLKQKRGEFLLNYMSDHINRHINYNAVSDSFGRFLDNQYWMDDFAELPDDIRGELRMLYLLKQRMKDARIATYLPDFSIMLPRQERVKMRLILGTNDKKGLELFRDIQDKVEREEIKIRRDLREDKKLQGNLFSEKDHVEFEQQNKGVGCAKYKRFAEHLIAAEVNKHREVPYSDLWPFVIENIPIKESQVKSLIQDMKKRGVVNYVLPKRRRSLQPETRIKIIDENCTMEDFGR